MMTEEEWKAVEQRMRILQACCGPDSMLSDQERIELAAHRELKSRREDEEWLKVYLIQMFYDDEWNIEHIGADGSEYANGPTIHAAIEQARGK
jgi:hypothetical protein